MVAEVSRRSLRGLIRRWLPLVIVLPVAYLVRPVFWTPLDHRFYNYFHSKRPVPPWTEVAVIAIDEPTAADLLDSPVHPLSRHTDKHALLTRQLAAAGVRSVVFDLRMTKDLFDSEPLQLAEVFRSIGKVYLVMSLVEKRRSVGSGTESVLFEATAPHPDLVDASNGAFVVDVRTDPDGVLRRYRPDPRIEQLGVESLPEHLSGVRVTKNTPIEFPSERSRIPMVSYRDVCHGSKEALSAVHGRIAFVGSVLDESVDYVDVPRIQQMDGGQKAFLMPGVAALAAITETLLRGAPIRDASGPETFVWILLWSMATLVLMPRRKPVQAALVLLVSLLIALGTTGLLHSLKGLVLPAGLLLGCLAFAGTFTLIVDQFETTRALIIEEMENKRVHSELETARRTQERFLPKTIPNVEGYDVWGVNISSLEVSGDYFDIIDLGESKPLVIAIADVSGKGLPAALLMSNVQAGLHSHLFQEDFDIVKTIGNLNRLIYENTEQEVFVTMFLAELWKAERRLRYIRAGHEVPLIVSHNGSVEELEEGGLILGYMPDAPYEVTEIELRDDQVLCLFTDGVTEARSQNDEEFQADRLVDALKASRNRKAKDIVENLVKTVEEFTGLPRQSDDVTIVVMRVRS